MGIKGKVQQVFKGKYLCKEGDVIQLKDYPNVLLEIKEIRRDNYGSPCYIFNHKGQDYYFSQKEMKELVLKISAQSKR